MYALFMLRAPSNFPCVWSRLFDVGAANSAFGISHMLSTAIPGTSYGQRNTASAVGALTVGFLVPNSNYARYFHGL